MTPRHSWLALILAAMFLTASGVAQAVPILVTVSEESNDPGNVPASDLNATLLFTVTGTTLTIDVTNTTNTLSLQDYDISAFNFNTNEADISNLVLTGYPSTDAGWTQGSTSSGGFNPFDDGASANPDLTDNAVGLNPDLVNAGETGTFTYSFDCAGTCTEEDFIVANDSGYTVAVKFINGGAPPFASSDSAWGATTSSGVPIPEPSTASLLMLGLVGLGAARRRRVFRRNGRCEPAAPVGPLARPVPLARSS